MCGATRRHRTSQAWSRTAVQALLIGHRQSVTRLHHTAAPGFLPGPLIELLADRSCKSRQEAVAFPGRSRFRSRSAAKSHPYRLLKNARAAFLSSTFIYRTCVFASDEIYDSRSAFQCVQCAPLRRARGAEVSCGPPRGRRREEREVKVVVSPPPRSLPLTT
jgi:hypothetical protein